ncbi:ABC transporter ATP-binding protein [Trebonia kvetii]|uniref:ABC transporter ATP-binding protein n=1 Tax=Trebonia kvetii TaxID=2480626 RepID=A0A6P2C5C4_9ACTN|nr:ABC transporter ATP-binding protein [Trebonia kvetii]TVZ05705.1 ABC transporter ATP-binding protein [Trebonia kvetii]
MSQSPVAALWRLRPYLRPYRKQLIIMVTAALVVEAADIAVPLVTKSVIDGAIAHHERGLLLPLGLLAIALGALSAGLSLIRRWVQGNAVANMEKDIRDDLYAHLQRLEPAFHDEWQSGQLLSRATTDLGTIRRFMGFGIVFLFISTMTFTAVSALLISLNWWLGLITMAMFVPVFVFCLRFEKKYKVLARRAQDQDGDLTTLVEEAATGVRVLKALGRAPEAADTHYAEADQLSRTRIAMAGVVGWFWSVLTLVPNAVIALAVVLGAVAVSKHAMTVGGLVAYITLGLQLVWPVEALGYILASGEEAATAAQRVVEIFDTDPAITSEAADEEEDHPERVVVPLTAEPRLPAPGHPSIRGVTGGSAPGGKTDHGPDLGHAAHVLFDNVSFSYPGDRRPVLSEVNLEVTRGETLVLTGATGSGKTTLLYLVPRLADVSGGRVLLAGRDVRDIPLPQLRQRVACGFEEATLFSASVRENVTFGAADATEEEIEAALIAAQASFVFELPWGLDTRIGEQGMALSGGQRQRVALARAILSRPEVLILDDPLSALDVQTEERVTRALHEILAGVTAIVVAHRPSTVALGDRVALLDDGVIAAVGSHRELMATDPVYANLMTMEEVAR